MWNVVARAERDVLGEGPIWSARDNALYWVDILAPALNRMSLSDMAVARIPMPDLIGWVVERSNGSGFIAGFKSGFVELDLDPVRVRPIGNPEPFLPGNRMNDGKADAAGRIWAGTKDMADKVASGALYRLDGDRTWTKMDDGYRVPNGPAFSPDGRYFYHADSGRQIVYRYPLREDGTLGMREPFIRFADEDGCPDGMTVDADGGLWVAHWEGWRISRFHPDGSWDLSIQLPTSRITSIAFAGPALDRMFVTSASIDIEHEELAGAIFEVAVGRRGIAPGRSPI